MQAAGVELDGRFICKARPITRRASPYARESALRIMRPAFAIGIHHGMVLTPYHLLARIITTRAARPSSYALAVDDRRRRTLLAA